jgi:hypothetical protein
MPARPRLRAPQRTLPFFIFSALRVKQREYNQAQVVMIVGRLTQLALCAVVATSLHAQGLIEHEKIGAANQTFDSQSGGPRLNCIIEPRSPFLDFAFRFELGYVVRCPLNEFAGKTSQLTALLRVTPQGGQPVLFAQVYRIPGMRPELAKTTDIRKVNAEISASGIIALGEGKYTAELVVMDDRERVVQKKWSAKAVRKHDEKRVQVTTRPFTATPITSRFFPNKLATPGSGIRLTVLLNAAPVNPKALKLRAWDRAFLLDSVASVLREIPYDTVRVVAFNLDQQEEIFRQDDFDRAGLAGLARALRKLELGSISYRKLGEPQGWSALLTRLSKDEVEAKNPADAVIFLGPTTRISDKIPKEGIALPKQKRTRFYYLEYFPAWRRGNEMPDAIHHFTAECDGTVLKIHSPAELATAIQRLRADLHLAAETEAEAEVRGFAKSGY